MKTPLHLLAAVLVVASSCWRSEHQSNLPAPTEQIRSLLCAIDQNNYEAAQKTLGLLLVSDPKNVNYRKALLGVQTRAVRQDDQSAQNVALIKKTIEGYNQALKDLPFTTDEKRSVDKSLVFLFEQLGDEELKNELLRRADDAQRAAKDRTEAYVILASKAWDCSFRITSSKTPLDNAAVEKAQTCTNDGLRYANEALTLVPDDESAWSYKTNLLREAVTLASLRKDEAQKAAYQKQYDESLKHTQEISERARAQREKEGEQTNETAKNDSSATEEDTKDLTELNLENSFDKVASELLVRPLDLPQLVAPANGSKAENQSDKSSGSSAQQKSDSTTFTANDDLALDLPANVQRTAGGGYTASSEGVIYSLIPVPRASVQMEKEVVNGTLNTLARTQARFVSRMWLGSAFGNRYELRFLRNEDVGGQPRKIYSYSLISCGQRKEGVLIVQASRTHFYTIDINGAPASDPRVQRVITSIKFNAEGVR